MFVYGLCCMECGYCTRLALKRHCAQKSALSPTVEISQVFFPLRKTYLQMPGLCFNSQNWMKGASTGNPHA